MKKFDIRPLGSSLPEIYLTVPSVGTGTTDPGRVTKDFGVMELCYELGFFGPKCYKKWPFGAVLSGV